jgi:hypothetical protein
MTRHFSTSLSLVLSSAGSHLRAANEPRANGASEADVIWMNNDFERLSDHPPASIVGQIREEVTAVAAASPPHITPAIRVKGMMEKVLFQ